MLSGHCPPSVPPAPLPAAVTPVPSCFLTPLLAVQALSLPKLPHCWGVGGRGGGPCPSEAGGPGGGGMGAAAGRGGEASG